MIMKWRRERDSNPRYLLGIHAFQACALNHSAISPLNFNLKWQASARNVFWQRTSQDQAARHSFLISSGFAPLPAVRANSKRRDVWQGARRFRPSSAGNEKIPGELN